MKLYTKRGDAGETDLFGGERVPKDHARVAAIGDVDELNAAIGLALVALDETAENEWRSRLRSIQDRLFTLGAELATAALERKVGTPEGKGPQARAWVPTITPQDIEELERWIDAACAEVPPLRNFVLPGGNELAARLHLARTVCRRAERLVVTVSRAVPREQAVAPTTIVFLNRLSDLLFAWARLANFRAAAPEIIWKPRPGD
jgi:cob(I)alamin adenosyltransferase